MSKFAPNVEEQDMGDTVTVEKYVGSIQEAKRIIVSEIIA